MKGTRTKSLKEALKTQEPEHNNLLNVIVEQQLKNPICGNIKKANTIKTMSNHLNKITINIIIIIIIIIFYIIIILMINQSISLDGSSVVYATELIKVNETGNTTLNETIIEVAGEGNITQQDVNDSISPLQAEIDVLNGKQLQNFNGINNINTDLTNNYQTTTQLNGNFVSLSTLRNYYTSTEIDTTLGNYYTSTQVDTTLGNYYTSAQVDTLIAGAGGGGGYTDTEIDNLLNPILLIDLAHSL